MPTLLASAVAAALWFSPPVPAQLPARRPAVLVPLYLAHGAFQAVDIYSTSRAFRAGARESNPVLAPLAGNVLTLATVKAASVATTVYFVERLWPRHKVGAVVVMAALNGVVAAVSVHNARVMRRMRGRD